MATTTKREASGTATTLAGIAILVVFVVGMTVPIVLSVLLWLTPDTTQRTGDGGVFISASTSAGGFLSLPVTSVQTSNGTIAVVGAFSGLHGQRLRIREGIKSGLQLCTEGPTTTCTDMAGPWTGQLAPVPHRRSMTDWIPAYIGDSALSLWFLIGFFATIVVGIALARIGGWNNDENELKSSKSSNSLP